MEWADQGRLLVKVRGRGENTGNTHGQEPKAQMIHQDSLSPLK
jgi:hypothetical protein